MLARERVAVGELVERVAGAGEDAGALHHLIATSDVAFGVQKKIERIVENLVLNAAKHTPAGTRIDVRLETADRDLLLIVEDHGPGIPDEFKEAVFETFNRGPNILALTPGAGIGLALVDRFAAVHGGRCWVTDTAGGGASFHVLLPDCVRDAQRPAAVS